MIDLSNFDWGWMSEPTDKTFIHNDGRVQAMGEYHKDTIISEIFLQRAYERFFEVDEGDFVLDIGASVGPFTYSILHKKPKHVICLEPSENEFKTLFKNVCGYPVTPINKGISNVNSIEESNELFGGESHMETITFDKLRNLFSLEKIDFIKTDCEGGEYYIFNDENMSFIKKNVKKIVGEWHLSLKDQNAKFRHFRDTYLKEFPNHEVYSIDGVNIKWDLWNEHFLEYYRQVILYIDNRN